MVMVEMLPVAQTQQAAAPLPSKLKPVADIPDPQALPAFPAPADLPAVKKAVEVPKSGSPVVAAAQPSRALARTTGSQGERRNDTVVRERLERFKYYPASARRRGIAGDVEVGFRLRSDGSAEEVLVLASSGYDILDRAALETVSRAQPFPAASGSYQFRLRFRRL